MTNQINNNREAAILTELQQLKDLKTDTQKQVAKDNYLKLSQAYAHMHMDAQLLKSWAANTAINKNSFTHEGKIYYTYGLNFITGDHAKYEARLNSLKDGKEFSTKLLLELTQYETKLTTIATHYMDGKQEVKQLHADGVRNLKKAIDSKIGWADQMMSHMDAASRAQYNAFKARYFGEILTGIDQRYMVVPKILESKKKATMLGMTYDVVDPSKDVAHLSASKAGDIVKQWMNAGPVSALNQLKNLHTKLSINKDYTDTQVRNIQIYTQALHSAMGDVLLKYLSQAKNQGAIESAQRNIIQFATLITGKSEGYTVSTKIQSWLGANGIDDRFGDAATASSVLKKALMKDSVESMGLEIAQEVHHELQSDAHEAVANLKSIKLTVDPATKQPINQSVYDFLVSHRFFTNLPGALTTGYNKKGSDKVRGDLSAVIVLKDYIASENKQGIKTDQLIEELCANPRELWQGSIGGQAQSVVNSKVDDILGGGKTFNGRGLSDHILKSSYWWGKDITGLTNQQKQIHDLYKSISGAGALSRSNDTKKMTKEMAKGLFPTVLAMGMISTGLGAPAGVALIGGTVVGTSAYWAMDGRKFNSTKEMLIDRGSEMGLNVATAWGGAKIAKYGANVAGKYLARGANPLVKIPLTSGKIPSQVVKVMESKGLTEASDLVLMTAKGIKSIGFAINGTAALADAGLGMGAEVFRQNILLENEQSFRDVFTSPESLITGGLALLGAVNGGDTKHAVIKANVEYLDGYVKAHPEVRNEPIRLSADHYTTLGRVHDMILKPAMQGKFTDSQGYVHLPDQVTAKFVAGVQEYGKLGIKATKTTTNIDFVEAKKTIRKEVVENASLTWDAKLSKLESELKNQGLLTENLTADQKALLREIEDVGGQVYMLTAEQRAQKLALASSDKAKALFGDNVDQVMRYAMDEGYLGLIPSDIALLTTSTNDLNRWMNNHHSTPLTNAELRTFKTTLERSENEFRNRGGSNADNPDILRDIQNARAFYDAEVQGRAGNNTNNTGNNTNNTGNNTNNTGNNTNNTGNNTNNTGLSNIDTKILAVHNKYGQTFFNNIVSISDLLGLKEEIKKLKSEIAANKDQTNVDGNIIKHKEINQYEHLVEELKGKLKEKIKDIAPDEIKAILDNTSNDSEKKSIKEEVDKVNTFKDNIKKVLGMRPNEPFLWDKISDFETIYNNKENRVQISTNPPVSKSVHDLIMEVAIDDKGLANFESAQKRSDSIKKVFEGVFSEDEMNIMCPELDLSNNTKIKGDIENILKGDTHNTAYINYQKARNGMKRPHELIAEARKNGKQLTFNEVIKQFKDNQTNAKIDFNATKGFFEGIGKEKRNLGGVLFSTKASDVNYSIDNLKDPRAKYKVDCVRFNIDGCYVGPNGEIEFSPKSGFTHHGEGSLLKKLQSQVDAGDHDGVKSTLAEIEIERKKLEDADIGKADKIHDLLDKSKEISGSGITEFNKTMASFRNNRNAIKVNKDYAKFWDYYLELFARREKLLRMSHSKDDVQGIMTSIDAYMNEMSDFYSNSLQTSIQRSFTGDWSMSRQLIEAYEKRKAMGGNAYMSEMDEIYLRAKNVIKLFGSYGGDIMQYEKLDRIAKKVNNPSFDFKESSKMTDLASKSIPLMGRMIKTVVNTLGLESKILRGEIALEGIGDNVRGGVRGLTTGVVAGLTGGGLYGGITMGVLQYTISHNLVNRFGNTPATKFFIAIADVIISHWLGVGVDMLIDDQQDDSTTGIVKKWLNANAESLKFGSILHSMGLTNSSSEQWEHRLQRYNFQEPENQKAFEIAQKGSFSSEIGNLTDSKDKIDQGLFKGMIYSMNTYDKVHKFVESDPELVQKLEQIRDLTTNTDIPMKERRSKMIEFHNLISKLDDKGYTVESIKKITDQILSAQGTQGLDEMKGDNKAEPEQLDEYEKMRQQDNQKNTDIDSHENTDQVPQEKPKEEWERILESSKKSISTGNGEIPSDGSGVGNDYGPIIE